MKQTLGYRISIAIIPTALAFLVRLWFATCRVRVHGKKYRDMVMADEGSAVGTFWHYGFLYSFYHNRKEKVIAMVSGSKDGEYISRFVEKFGIPAVRGSRNRGGIAALKGMIRGMKKGYSAGIVGDGSQGPARVLQAGCIILASRSGAPIVPMGWSCNRYLSFNSWDKTAIPYPFSKIEFFYGEPIEIPPKVSQEETEVFRKLVEERLNQIYDQAWALQNKKEH